MQQQVIHGVSPASEGGCGLGSDGGTERVVLTGSGAGGAFFIAVPCCTWGTAELVLEIFLTKYFTM